MSPADASGIITPITQRLIPLPPARQTLLAGLAIYGFPSDSIFFGFQRMMVNDIAIFTYPVLLGFQVLRRRLLPSRSGQTRLFHFLLLAPPAARHLVETGLTSRVNKLIVFLEIMPPPATTATQLR